jgi:hypothetical protein
MINIVRIPCFSQSWNHHGYIPQSFLTDSQKSSLMTANMPTQPRSATAPTGTELPKHKGTVSDMTFPKQDMIVGEQKRELDESLHHLIAATRGLLGFPLPPFPPQSDSTYP